MLEDIRKETINGVCTLSPEQLFQAPASGEFPIGAYLMHLAECDIHWLDVLSGSSMSEDLKAACFFDQWFDPSGESSPPVKAPAISDYSAVMRETRKRFIDYFTSLDDSELEEYSVMKSKRGDLKITKKWIIYHIIEHEAHHRGQIFMLMRQAGWKNDHQMLDRKSEWWPGEAQA